MAFRGCQTRIAHGDPGRPRSRRRVCARLRAVQPPGLRARWLQPQIWALQRLRQSRPSMPNRPFRAATRSSLVHLLRQRMKRYRVCGASPTMLRSRAGATYRHCPFGATTGAVTTRSKAEALLRQVGRRPGDERQRELAPVADGTSDALVCRRRPARPTRSRSCRRRPDGSWEIAAADGPGAIGQAQPIRRGVLAAIRQA